MAHGYRDLTRFGWTPGVHKSPTTYEHPWIVVTKDGTLGAWSREEARNLWRGWKQGAACRARGLKEA